MVSPTCRPAHRRRSEFPQATRKRPRPARRSMRSERRTHVPGEQNRIRRRRMLGLRDRSLQQYAAVFENNNFNYSFKTPLSTTVLPSIVTVQPARWPTTPPVASFVPPAQVLFPEPSVTIPAE